MFTCLHTPAVPGTFDSTRAIQVHLDHRDQIQNYVNGSLRGLLNVPTGCHESCQLGKWLREEGRKQCGDVGLLDSICQSCEEFYEAASHVILLANMQDTESAKAAMQDGKTFSEASEKLQQNLTRLNCSSL